MARVGVTVNGQAYQVTCEDGEEERVEYLADFLDKRISEVVADVGQVGEARLLLMAGLLTADDLAEAYKQIEELNARLEEVSAAEGTAAGEVTRAAESVMTGVARRLEDIAAKLEIA